MTKINTRDHAILKEDYVQHPKDMKYPNTWMGVDDAWNFEKFKDEFRWSIQKVEKLEVSFDLIGVAPCIANALRRLMIAEVPTMAIEKVYVTNNTSVMHDELLAHRIGLVPVLVDPRRFDDFDGEETDLNTLVFKLKKECKYKQNMPSAEVSKPSDLYENFKIVSNDLKWIPEGIQSEWMEEITLLSDVPLLELRPGQAVELECHAWKGVGKDHAKFSPVCTASYRLLPCIDIVKEIKGKEAFKFQKCFSKGVIGIKDGKAFVENARIDSVSRECLRHSEFSQKVVLGRQKDHFIFVVESSGALDSALIVITGLNVLKKKLANIQCNLRESDFYVDSLQKD
eukprot:NODE_3_length_80033_cov_0.932970.p21 type:complete len:341 gc:universal NODE_3_length_80033_cov_0.932970:37257-38279(+)